MPLKLTVKQVGALRIFLGRFIADQQAVARLHGSFDTHLTDARARANVRFRAALEMADAGGEGDFSMDEFYDLKRFPDIVMTALFVTQHSHLEFMLVALSDFFHRAGEVTSAPDEVRGRGISRASRYLIRTGVFPFPEYGRWRQVKALARIRNVVVHRRGIVPADDARTSQAVEQLDSVTIPTLPVPRRLGFRPQFIPEVTEIYCGFAGELEQSLLRPARMSE